MSSFLNASKALKVESLPWLAAQRERAESLWNVTTLPTRKSEDWKYSNLSGLEKHNFFDAKPIDVNASELVKKAAFLGADANILVFVNGEFDSSLSSFVAEEGLDCVCFSNANEQQQETISGLLNSCVDYEKHSFAALNTKSISDGVFVRVQKAARIVRPIHVLHIATESAQARAISNRLLVDVQASSALSIIEHFVSEFEAEQSEPVFNNSLTELILAENAELSHYRLMEESESVQHISGVHTRLGRSSRFNSFYLALGTKLTRVDASVSFEGEGAEAELNGVYLPQNKQHVDFHTNIEHAVPHCTSKETFRGIISDRARAVFNGRIHIHRNAQKSEAYLSNKNLLTSNKAEVDTKPELEIYADDVRCAHGATVAQLESSAMHYLKTRGISEEEAQVMLSFGFINELIGNIKLDAIANYCRPKLASRFSRDETLIRHLK